jgi:hypothetical protein
VQQALLEDAAAMKTAQSQYMNIISSRHLEPSRLLKQLKRRGLQTAELNCLHFFACWWGRLPTAEAVRFENDSEHFKESAAESDEIVCYLRILDCKRR